MRRKRLLEQLRTFRDAHGTLIGAPAGYGKTTLLTQLLAEARERGRLVCWYTLDPADGDAATLLRGLVGTVAAHRPGFGDAVLRLLSDASSAPDASYASAGTVGPATSLFLEELHTGLQTRWTGGVLLILDDCHTIAGSAASTALLDTLLSKAPERCHIVLSGRTLPDLPSRPRLEAQRQVLVLGQDKLALSRRETGELVAALGGRPALDDDEEADDLWRQTGGWPMAVSLLAAHTGERKRRPKAADGALPDQVEGILFAFLAADVLDGLPADLRSFVLGASVLPYVDASSASQLLGLPPADARRLLETCASRSLFLSRLDAPESVGAAAAEADTYRFHDLFRDFLKERLHEEQPVRSRWLQRRAAVLAEAAGDVPRAVEHALAARLYHRTGRLIQDVFETMASRDQWGALQRWLDQLPEKVIQGSPRLVVTAARAYMFASAAASDDRWLVRAERLLDPACPEAVELALARAIALRDRGEHQEAVGVLQRQLSRLDDSAPYVLRARISVQMASELKRLGQLEEAARAYVQARELAVRASDRAREALALDGIGLVELRRGRLAEAVVAFRRAGAFWRQSRNQMAQAVTENNLGLAEHYLGNFEAATRAFRRAAKVAHDAGYSGPEGCAWLSLGDVLRDQDNLAAAADAYKRGLDLVRSVSSAYLERCALDSMSHVHRLGSELDTAEALAMQTVLAAKEAGAKQEQGRYLRSLALVQYARGDHDAARLTLDEAAVLLHATGAQRDLAQVYLAQAQVAQATRRFADVRQHLAALERLLVQLGYHGFLLADARRALAVLDYGIARRAAGARVQALRAAAIRPLMAAPATPLTPPARPKGLEVAPPDAGSSALALRAWSLGRSRVQCRSGKITSRTWRGDKSKELIFYLLCHPGWQRRERIQADLWIDANETQARDAFHSAIYRLRRTLGAGLIQEDQGRYRLNPGTTIWFDADEFERCSAACLDLGSPTVLRDAREAIELYRGAFLEDLSPEWSLPIRDRLEGLHVAICVRMAHALLEVGQVAAAAELAHCALNKDPDLEDARSLLVRCQIDAAKTVATTAPSCGVDGQPVLDLSQAGHPGRAAPEFALR